MNKTFLSKVKFFLASLFVVLIGVFLNFIYSKFFLGLQINQSHLVDIPIISNFISLVTFLNFNAISNYHVWLVGLTIAIVRSLETLLNLKAAENIDPHKRQASPNRELLA